MCVLLSYLLNFCLGFKLVELVGFYGLVGVNVGMIIVFVGKDFDFLFSLGYFKMELFR